MKFKRTPSKENYKELKRALLQTEDVQQPALIGEIRRLQESDAKLREPVIQVSLVVHQTGAMSVMTTADYIADLAAKARALDLIKNALQVAMRDIEERHKKIVMSHTEKITKELEQYKQGNNGQQQGRE